MVHNAGQWCSTQVDDAQRSSAQTDRQTDGKKVIHTSPPGISTGVLKMKELDIDVNPPANTVCHILGGEVCYYFYHQGERNMTYIRQDQLMPYKALCSLSCQIYVIFHDTIVI